MNYYYYESYAMNHYHISNQGEPKKQWREVIAYLAARGSRNYIRFGYEIGTHMEAAKGEKCLLVLGLAPHS